MRASIILSRILLRSLHPILFKIMLEGFFQMLYCLMNVLLIYHNICTYKMSVIQMCFYFTYFHPNKLNGLDACLLYKSRLCASPLANDFLLFKE